MGISARYPSTAITSSFIPEIYDNRVIDAVKKNLVAWESIDGSWASGLVKGYKLYMPKTNVVAATEVTVGTQASSTNPFNTTAASLTIDQWWEAPVKVDYMTLRQTQANVEAVAAKEAAYAVSLKMDSTVCALFYGLGGYTASGYGADGQTLNDDILLYLVETLDEADVPREDRVLIGDPSTVVDMLKIDKFIQAQYVAMGAVSSGVVGKSPIYGFTLKVTNNLLAATTGSYGVLMQKRALAGVAQIEKSWTKEFEELHYRLYQSEALWGVAEVNDSFGVPFFTRKA